MKKLTLILGLVLFCLTSQEAFAQKGKQKDKAPKEHREHSEDLDKPEKSKERPSRKGQNDGDVDSEDGYNKKSTKNKGKGRPTSDDDEYEDDDKEFDHDDHDRNEDGSESGKGKKNKNRKDKDYTDDQYSRPILNQGLFSEIDQNDNGKISYGEFKKSELAKRESNNRDRKKMFKKFDRNKDNSITKEELIF